MVLRTVVIVVHGRIELQIRNPRLAQKPGKRGVCTEYIVPQLAPGPDIGIRIVLRIHTSDVACGADFELQHLLERVAV